MKKISRNLFFYKKIYPVIVFVFLSFVLLFALRSKLFINPPENLISSLISLISTFTFMCVVYYLYIKYRIFALVDEVYDCDLFLLIKNKGQEDRIMLADIVNIERRSGVPARYILTLSKPCMFGKKASFSPLQKLTIDPLKNGRIIINDLMTRIDQAKRKTSI